MLKMAELATPGVRLCLFVAKDTPRSVIALANIRRALREFVDSAFALEVVNVFDDPDRALSERVLVTPTLLAPDSARRIVGDLSEHSQLHYFLQGLPAA
jgi:circadian clock protein KaiB